MNIVDSSGWLEYFSGGSNAEYFLSPLEDPSSLIVPTITIYEFLKWSYARPAKMRRFNPSLLCKKDRLLI
jgi:hypothetical protein